MRVCYLRCVCCLREKQSACNIYSFRHSDVFKISPICFPAASSIGAVVVSGFKRVCYLHYSTPPRTATHFPTRCQTTTCATRHVHLTYTVISYCRLFMCIAFQSAIQLFASREVTTLICTQRIMRRIVHNCTHGEELVIRPECEDQMFELIFKYIDRLVAAARPRRLLYIAVDGVAPRAKMNQQRSRRFRASKEMQQNDEIEERFRSSLIARGQVPPEKKKKSWDHNVITPGLAGQHENHRDCHVPSLGVLFYFCFIFVLFFLFY